VENPLSARARKLRHEFDSVNDFSTVLNRLGDICGGQTVEFVPLVVLPNQSELDDEVN
jgi:hypothetical protein